MESPALAPPEVQIDLAIQQQWDFLILSLWLMKPFTFVRGIHSHAACFCAGMKLSWQLLPVNLSRMTTTTLSSKSGESSGDDALCKSIFPGDYENRSCGVGVGVGVGSCWWVFVYRKPYGLRWKLLIMQNFSLSSVGSTIWFVLIVSFLRFSIEQPPSDLLGHGLDFITEIVMFVHTI